MAEQNSGGKAYLALAVGVTGSSFVGFFTRFSGVSSMTLCSLRMITTMVLFTVWIMVSGGWKQLRGIRPKQLALCGLAGFIFAVHLVSSFEAVRSTSMAAANVLLCTEVIFVALIGLVLGNRLNGRRWCYILLAFAGSVLVGVGGSRGGSGPAPVYGCIIALVGSLLSAIYTLLGQRLRKGGLSTIAYTYVLYGSTMVSIIVLCLLRGEPVASASLREWGPALGMAVCGAFLGHSMYSYCLKFLHPAHVSAGKLMVPVLSGLAAIPIFGEIPTPLTLAGCVLVLLAVLAYTLLEARTSRQEEKNHAN